MKIKKSIISLALCLAMILGMLPASYFDAYNAKAATQTVVSDSLPISGDITLYSMGEEYEKHKVTFALGDKEGKGDVNEKYVYDGYSVKAPDKSETLAYDGRGVTGWYADKELTTPFDFSTPIKESTTIYAKWCEPISDIIIYGYKPAAIGNIVDSSMIGTPDDVHYKLFGYSSGWYMKDSRTPGGRKSVEGQKFKEGYVYEFYICLDFDEGYKWDVNGMTFYDGDGNVIKKIDYGASGVSFIVDFGKYIDTVRIEGVDVPAPGKTPSVDTIKSASAVPNYTISNPKWYETVEDSWGDPHVEEVSGKFQAGKIYTLVFEVAPNDGYGLREYLEDGSTNISYECYANDKYTGFGYRRSYDLAYYFIDFEVYDCGSLHEFEDGICKNCGYECEHDRFEKGVCLDCGLTSSITLDKTSVIMATKSSIKLNATIKLASPGAKVIWESSDESVATVAQDGTVTARRYGKATISARIQGGNVATVDVSTRFWDVNGSADKGAPDYMYYYLPVYWAAENGITTGYDRVYFGPQKECSRREMLIFLWRVSGCPEGYGDAKKYFADLGKYDASSATNKAIAWAYKTGLTKGYSEGGKTVFKPEDSIQRKDTLIFLYRLAGKPATKGEVKFPDVIALKYSKTSDTYKAILWGSQTKITGGYSDGNFKPTDNCQREHIITFLYRYVNLK